MPLMLQHWGFLHGYAGTPASLCGEVGMIAGDILRPDCPERTV